MNTSHPDEQALEARGFAVVMFLAGLLVGAMLGFAAAWAVI